MSPRHHSPLGGFSGRILGAAALVVVMVVGATLAPSWNGTASPAGAAATYTVALYDMNESANATTMIDSSGNGLHGTIGDEVTQPVTFTDSTGATGTGHRFAVLLPADPDQPRPEHINLVPDDPQLDPDAQDYAITIRFRKTYSFGNIIQKGQNQTVGGYFKIEMPGETASCLFKDSTGVTGGVTTPAGINVRDGNWHVLRCERNRNEVLLFVDGVQVAKTGATLGTIANNRPLSIAGKSNCNPFPTDGSESVTCDYFIGDIDYVRLEKGTGAPNKAPSASFTAVCNAATGAFNGGASNDPDGDIVRYAWQFGDGSTSDETDDSTSHVYAQSGNYTVRLTVTDDDGATATTTRSCRITVPTTTTSTTTSTTTTTTIVDQQGPTVIDEVPDAAGASQVAVRLTPTASP